MKGLESVRGWCFWFTVKHLEIGRTLKKEIRIPSKTTLPFYFRLIILKQLRIFYRKINKITLHTGLFVEICGALASHSTSVENQKEKSNDFFQENNFLFLI